MFRRFVPLFLALGVFAAGCDAPEAQFHLDQVYIHKKISPPETREAADNLERQLQNVKDVMIGLFGTPDEPHTPQLADVDVDQVLDPDLINLAAGPVGRDERGLARGLYREHCAHCHGVTGDGAGPTAAFLNPYPRDYRLGKFKFKSTPLGVKPTHDDLRKIIIEGIPDTAMPSFRLLADDEIDALADYVKYLSIRGETERALVDLLMELDEGELLLDPAAAQPDADPEDAELFQENLALVQETVGAVIGRWANAPSQITEVPPPPENWLSEQSVEEGRELFYAVSAGNCVKCHGNLALGDGETGDYDDWVKDLADANPAQRAAEYVALGIAEPRVLDPRPIRPRNLRTGVYRGGRRPVDLFLRVKNGIEGTPMPQAAANLTPDQLWKIVAYVRSLPHEAISQPEGYDPEFERERM